MPEICFDNRKHPKIDSIRILCIRMYQNQPQLYNTMRFTNFTLLAMILNNDFAGRTNDPHYDDTKPYRNHRRNRAFVWSDEMQENLLDSMLKGYAIPPIYCNRRIEGGREIYEIMEGGNRVTTLRRILSGKIRTLTEEEKFKVQTYQFQIVAYNDLTVVEQRIMFQRLNKNVKVRDGQLYAMSEEDSPLVMEATEMLTLNEYPHRHRITAVFGDTTKGDNSAGKDVLANAVAIVCGAVHGVEHITKSFARNTAQVDDQTLIDRVKVERMLDKILTVYERADAHRRLEGKTKRRKQMTIGGSLGAMMYDFLLAEDGNDADITDKWVKWNIAIRDNTPGAEDAIELPGSKNIDPTHLKRKSYKVGVFVDTGVVMTKDDIMKIRHVYADNQEQDNAETEDEAEDDEESDDSDAN